MSNIFGLFLFYNPIKISITFGNLTKLYVLTYERTFSAKITSAVSVLDISIKVTCGMAQRYL